MILWKSTLQTLKEKSDKKGERKGGKTSDKKGEKGLGRWHGRGKGKSKTHKVPIWVQVAFGQLTQA